MKKCFLFLISIALSIIIVCNKEKSHSMEDVKALNASIKHLKDRNVRIMDNNTIVVFYKSKTANDDLKYIKFFNDLEMLIISDKNINDKGLEYGMHP